MENMGKNIENMGTYQKMSEHTGTYGKHMGTCEKNTETHGEHLRKSFS